MILSGSFLGISYLNFAQALPVASTYNKITFYGNNIVDGIHLQNRLYSDSEVQALDINDYPAWDGYTLMLSRFDNQDTEAGNVTNLSSNITSWNIYRRATDEEISKNLATVDDTVTQYIDYTAQANKTYIYDIFPQTATQIGAPVETAQTLANFYGWYLVDTDTNTIYKFDLNLQSGDISNEIDFTEYKNYSKFPGFTFTDRDYIKVTVSAVCGSINQDGTIYQPVDYIEQLKDFINNKKEKLFKSRKGDIWRGITTNFKYKYMDEVGQQVAVVTFDFVESGSVD